MKDWTKYTIGFVIIILIFLVSLMLNPKAEFGGADVAGTEAILSINPTYQVWFNPLWTPKPETESMLFALQAAIGAFIIGYFVGTTRAETKAENKKSRK